MAQFGLASAAVASVTYQQAGVDIDAGERLVERIKPLAEGTRTPEVIASVGGFAGLCALPSGLRDPVIVSSTDGVGTKLDVAAQLERHRTIGIDLVAMCVNDLITVGARPMFFLDYFATGQLNVEQASAVVEGIAEGCREAGCALLGGETAEMPGMYLPGRYDLAGFAVGVVERSAILDGSKIREGHAVVGLASSGLHSNGYSLARKVLLRSEQSLDERPGTLDKTIGEALLEPTRIYARAIQAAMNTGEVFGACHITGGGLVGNIPRVLPQGLSVELDPSRWAVPPIFDLIAERGPVSQKEMQRAFNLGIGFVLVAPPEHAEPLCQRVSDCGEEAAIIGRVTRGEPSGSVRFVEDL